MELADSDYLLWFAGTSETSGKILLISPPGGAVAKKSLQTDRQ